MPFETLFPKPSAAKVQVGPQDVCCTVRTYLKEHKGLVLTLGVGFIRGLDLDAADCKVQIKIGTGADIGRLHLEKASSGGWKLSKPRKDGCRSINLTSLGEEMEFSKPKESGMAEAELVRPGSGLKPILKVKLPASVWTRS